MHRHYKIPIFKNPRKPKTFSRGRAAHVTVTNRQPPVAGAQKQRIRPCPLPLLREQADPSPGFLRIERRNRSSDQRAAQRIRSAISARVGRGKKRLTRPAVSKLSFGFNVAKVFLYVFIVYVNCQRTLVSLFIRHVLSGK